MMTLSRWLAPAALAVGLSVGALAAMPAHAQDNTWTRVLVDAADVALRGGQPYYRYGHYRDDDRLKSAQFVHARVDQLAVLEKERRRTFRILDQQPSRLSLVTKNPDQI